MDPLADRMNSDEASNNKDLVYQAHPGLVVYPLDTKISGLSFQVVYGSKRAAVSKE